MALILDELEDNNLPNLSENNMQMLPRLAKRPKLSVLFVQVLK